MDNGNSKVLLLIDRLGRGGAAQVVLDTALGLQAKGFDPIVCTTRHAPAAGQDDILKEAGIQFIELKRKSAWRFFPWMPLWKILPKISILFGRR